MKLCNKFYNNEGTLNFSTEAEIKESRKWRGEENEREDLRVC